MRINLQQRKFRIGFNYNPPYSAIKLNSRSYNGFEDEMFNILAKYFNFTYDLINFNGEYGFIDDNENWDGLIGGLINNILPIVEFH
uniref:Uncharacterized protein LOC113798651 n=1 Tax=Dermatophagoides pteronyssinus TaxID=6956 RepID=A0A6P6YJT8_DERPT|nr:uncharacterized protein LOC113798651 [Dermatophagoides pteronyssinus]